MSVSAKLSQNGSELTINVNGRFDFGVQNDFRDSYESTKADEYIIDMINTDYMDSSALGMLLLMREHAGGNASKITLKNCSQDIKTILSIANFHSLFNID